MKIHEIQQNAEKLSEFFDNLDDDMEVDEFRAKAKELLYEVNRRAKKVPVNGAEIDPHLVEEAEVIHSRWSQ